MKIKKFITYYQNLRKRFPTLKELERRTLKENKINTEIIKKPLKNKTKGPHAYLHDWLY